MTRPLFISFEGPDGSGKSTQARMLASALRERGIDVVETREPGGTPLGEQVRGVLLDHGGSPMTPLVMALLLSAARSQHVDEVIKPALVAGRTVISDRYADSTLAYQGYGLGVDLATLRELTRIATGGLQPHLSIYVEIEPEAGLTRIALRGDDNRLDALEMEVHRRVREGYRALIGEDADRWITVDGSGTPEEVHREVLGALEARLRREAGAA